MHPINVGRGGLVSGLRVTFPRQQWMARSLTIIEVSSDTEDRAEDPRS